MRIDVIPVYQSYPSSTTAPRATPSPRETGGQQHQQPAVISADAPRFKAGAAEFAQAELVLEARPVTTNPRQAHAMQVFQAVSEPEDNLHIIDIFA